MKQAETELINTIHIAIRDLAKDVALQREIMKHLSTRIREHNKDITDLMLKVRELDATIYS